MKKYLFAPAFFVLLAASCQSPLQDSRNQEAVAPEIIAETETQPETKTLISVDNEGVGTISWTPADEINIFYGTTNTHYFSQNTANATSAVFRTTDIIGSTESASTNVWGLYPYDRNATCTGSAVTTTLPAAQYGVPGTFDDDLFITLAQSSTHTLRFYNVCGGIKFSLSRSDITSVSFKGNNNEDIAGNISLVFENGLPKATVTSGQKEITLTPKTGSTFAQGVDYYIVALPCTLSNGFTMKFRTSGGTVRTFRYTAKPVTIKRSIFSKKANIDTYAKVENTYSKVLFIGNSITQHPICSYWWGLWGMAASRRENDYVHRVMAVLQENVPSASYVIGNIGMWELEFDDHEWRITPQYDLPGVDLVVIRLGENTDPGHVSEFEAGLGRLIDAIRLFINPRIVITGQYWTDAEKERACINAAANKGATYVRIDQYYTAEYKERVGNYVYGDDGQQHMIDNVAVAQHPSDLGMEKIAEAILAAVL